MVIIIIIIKALILGLCEGANPESDSKPNPEVVEELNVWFCLELSVSFEVRKESMLMTIVRFTRQ